jgi:hypothetical protein
VGSDGARVLRIDGASLARLLAGVPRAEQKGKKSTEEKRLHT